jgi:hypothetical protein
MKNRLYLVDGLNITGSMTPGQCKDCILANLKRRLYDDEVVTETVPLQ